MVRARLVQAKSFWIAVLAVLFMLPLLPTTPVQASGTTYYFSTSGNDSNDGLSPSTPKKSLTAAASLMNPGNTILLKRGDKWYSPSATWEWSVANKAGTASQPIVVGAYGSGDKPIVATMELMSSGWTNLGSNRWSHSLGGYTDVKRLFVNGVPKLKISDPNAVDSDSYAVSSSTVYLHATTAPTDVEVINNLSYSALHVTNSSYLTFQDLEFRGGSSWDAVRVDAPSSHVTFDSCNVTRFNLYGIQFANYGTDYSQYNESPVIQNCYINMGWAAYLNVVGSTWGGDGINFRNAVQNGLIRGNTIVDMGHTGIGLELIESPPDYVGVKNNIVEMNEVYDTVSGYTHAFTVQGPYGTVSGNIIRRNYFHDITNSSHLMGNNNYVYSNIFKTIYHSVSGDNADQAHAVDILPFTYNGNSYTGTDNVFANNTIYDTEFAGIRIDDNPENTWKNNIIVGWGANKQGFVNQGSQEPQIVENNLFWNNSSTGAVIAEGGSTYTAAQANTAFSNYNDNIQADPLFTDASGGDFRLQSGSPAASSGQVLSGIPGFVDFYGNPWDPAHPSMGAIQYGTALSGEMLGNRGFENGTSSWVAQWGGTLNAIASPVHSGSKAVSVTSRTGNYQGPVQDIKSMLLANGQGYYDLAGWGRLASGSGNGRVTISITDSNGSHWHFSNEATFNSTSYTQASGTVKITWTGSLDSAYLTLETTSSTADLYADDLSLRKHTTINSELLGNTGFEDGTSSWTPQWGGTLNAIASPVRSGSGAVSVTGRTGNYQGPVQDIKSLLLANGQGSYYLSGWGRLASGSDNGRVTLSITDSSGSHWNFSNQATFNSASYTQASGATNVTWTGTLVSAYITLETISSTATLYADDMSLVKVP